jgi:hypothetical protein
MSDTLRERAAIPVLAQGVGPCDHCEVRIDTQPAVVAIRTDDGAVLRERTLRLCPVCVETFYERMQSLGDFSLRAMGGVS